MKFKAITRFVRHAILIASVCLIVIPIAGQLYIKEFTLQELTTESSDIVVAKVISATSHWNKDHTRMYTEIELMVLENIKGDLNSEEHFKIFQLGGYINGIRTYVLEMPTLVVGNQSILFLNREQSPDHGDYFIISKLNQGTYDIITEQGIEKVLRHNVETPLRLETDGNLLSLTSYTGIPINTFIESIRLFIR